MRLVVDTNILISALLGNRSPAAELVDYWEKRRFDVLICEEQLDELARVTRYPKIRKRITPSVAGLLVNQLREVAIFINNVPSMDVSPDPDDNWLFGLAEAGDADYIVSGDKRHMVNLIKHDSTRIVTLAWMLDTLGH